MPLLLPHHTFSVCVGLEGDREKTGLSGRLLFFWPTTSLPGAWLSCSRPSWEGRKGIEDDAGQLLKTTPMATGNLAVPERWYPLQQPHSGMVPK